jgi:hypothetical protein
MTNPGLSGTVRPYGTSRLFASGGAGTAGRISRGVGVGQGVAVEAGTGRSPDAVLLAESSFILLLRGLLEAPGGGELLPSLAML